MTQDEFRKPAATDRDEDSGEDRGREDLVGVQRAEARLRLRIRRAQTSVRYLRQHHEDLRALLGELEGSLVWRLLESPLRIGMSPATLGRGNTILDDIGRLVERLGRRDEHLETLLEPTEIRCEVSEHLLERTYPTSILVTNWNGERQLAAFLDSYADHHEGDEAELVIVDHASEDGSLRLIRQWMRMLPIKLLNCDRNQRYSVANNLAEAYADGDRLVFANNDLVFDSAVIPELLSALDDPTVGLAGLPLYYPDESGARSERLQHNGIRFAPDPRTCLMRPWNEQAQDDRPDRFREVGAVTTALAACRKEDFLAVNGFPEDYDYGFEDVDLSLSLRRHLGLRVVVCSEVAAIHDESHSQRAQPGEMLKARRQRNAVLLRQRHNGQLVREVLRSQVEGGFWHREPLRIRVPADVELADLSESGQRPGVFVEHVDPGARWKVRRFSGLWVVDDPEELIEHEAPPGAISVALVRRGDADAWIGSRRLRCLELLLCQDESDADTLRRLSRASVVPVPAGTDPLGQTGLPWLLQVVLRELEKPAIAIKIATPDTSRAHIWGDFHFAEGLGRALRDRGYRVHTDPRQNWGATRMASDDITLTLRGLVRYEPEPGPLNLLWLISHPDRASDQELDGFDHVFVASSSYSKLLARRLRTPVSTLLQCTDPERFSFVAEPTHPERVLFVGNSRNDDRPLLTAALDQGLQPEIWGANWQGRIDESIIQGDYVENTRLGALYGNSGVVLADHWPQMRRHGFFSNRLFDALASGARVVSDSVFGMEALLGDAVAIQRAPGDDLAALCEGDGEPRSARRAFAERIAREHSFAVRAREIDTVIRQRLSLPAQEEESGFRAADQAETVRLPAAGGLDHSTA